MQVRNMQQNSLKMARALALGFVLSGLSVSSLYAWPDEKPRENQAAADLERILDKLPPEARERIKTEIRKAREQAERAQAELGNEARRVREEAERAGDEAREAVNRARAEAERQINRVREEMAQKEREVANRREQANSRAEAARRENAGPRDGERRVEERREVRVEVLKDGDKEPQVKITENGRPVDPDKAKSMIATIVPGQPLDLSKLPPEKREVIERARRDLKEAQERLKIAAEKLAKAEGREPGQAGVMMFRVDGPGGMKMMEGSPNIQLRMVPGDRLPNMPLPPGLGAMGGRLPGQPIVPVPGMAIPGPGPEIERRLSKTEKALDDILAELKKLQSKPDDDDDDEKEEKKEDKRETKRDTKPKK